MYKKNIIKIISDSLIKAKITVLLITLVFLISGLIPTSCSRYPNLDGNQIISLVLRWLAHENDGYLIVRPQTVFNQISGWDSGDTQAYKKWENAVQQWFREEKVPVDKLVESEFKLNRKPVLLSLESSQENGYVIDYEGKYSNEFKIGGYQRILGIWPEVSGYVGISVPAYDIKTGMVLVYVEYPLQGTMFILRYDKNSLSEITGIDIWYQ